MNVKNNKQKNLPSLFNVIQWSYIKEGDFVDNNIIRNSSVSTRVNKTVKDKATKNLAKRGITLSEYLRFAVGKAADDDIELINFLDSPEALNAKKEVEEGKVEKIGNLDDLNKWMDKL